MVRQGAWVGVFAVGIGLGMLWSGGRPAAAAEPEVEGRMVEFRGGAGPIKGYLARPKGEGPFPAVLVIHEWWGLNDWVKQNADRLAARGYVALAVDLYDGRKTDDPGRAHELMRALDPGEGVADLKGAVAYLRTAPLVAKGGKLGAIGWCMGGMYARLAAQGAEEVGPTVICYGSISTEAEQVAKLQGKPILGIFGAEDQGIPVAKVDQFAEAVRTKGTPVDLHIYPNAGHAFMRPGSASYREAEAAAAWGRIDAFFATHLRR